MATMPITRLPTWIDQEIRRYLKKYGEKPSPVYRRIIEEWWVTEVMPLLEFRDGVSGRRVGLRAGPDVWEVVLVARQYNRFGVKNSEYPLYFNLFTHQCLKGG